MKVNKELKFYNYDYSINGLYYLQIHTMALILVEFRLLEKSEK